MNTFASTISDFSLFDFFLNKPPDLLKLSFPPLEQFADTCKDFLQLHKDEAKFIARHFVRLQDSASTRSKYLMHQCTKISKLFGRRFVVSPRVYSIQTEAANKYVGY